VLRLVRAHDWQLIQIIVRRLGFEVASLSVLPGMTQLRHVSMGIAEFISGYGTESWAQALAALQAPTQVVKSPRWRAHGATAAVKVLQARPEMPRRHSSRRKLHPAQNVTNFYSAGKLGSSMWKGV